MAFVVQNKAGQNLTEFCQENALVIANTLSNNPREDSTHGHHQMVNTKIRLIMFSAAKNGEALYSQQKQDQKLTGFIKTYNTFRTNTQTRCPFHHRGLECKSRKSRDTWSNRQIWPWSTKRSSANANRVLPRERTGHSKHPLPTTQETTLHMDITR